MNNTLYALARNLQQIQIWTEGHSSPSRTLSPINNWTRSIFVTNNGDIYVDDASSPNNVYKWSVNSTTAVSAMIVPDSCFGLFVDVKENLYCSMESANYVMRKSLMDPINSTIIVAGNGTSGSGLNQLSGPRGVIVDFHLNLYVTECNNHRVIRFARDQLNGTIVVGSGAPGTIDLHCPSGIAFDADGYLFISEYDNHRIVGSGPNGFRCLVGCSGFGGPAADQLSRPYGLSFDRYGNLFVADRDNHRIQKFLLARNTCSEYDMTNDTIEERCSLSLLRPLLSSTTLVYQCQMDYPRNDSHEQHYRRLEPSKCFR